MSLFLHQSVSDVIAALAGALHTHSQAWRWPFALFSSETLSLSVPLSPISARDSVTFSRAFRGRRQHSHVQSSLIRVSLHIFCAFHHYSLALWHDWDILHLFGCRDPVHGAGDQLAIHASIIHCSQLNCRDGMVYVLLGRYSTLFCWHDLCSLVSRSSLFQCCSWFQTETLLSNVFFHR